MNSTKEQLAELDGALEPPNEIDPKTGNPYDWPTEAEEDALLPPAAGLHG